MNKELVIHKFHSNTGRTFDNATGSEKHQLLSGIFDDWIFVHECSRIVYIFVFLQTILPEEEIVANVAKDQVDVVADIIDHIPEQTNIMYPPLDPTTTISIPRPVLLSERYSLKMLKMLGYTSGTKGAKSTTPLVLNS